MITGNNILTYFYVSGSIDVSTTSELGVRIESADLCPIRL